VKYFYLLLAVSFNVFAGDDYHHGNNTMIGVSSQAEASASAKSIAVGVGIGVGGNAVGMGGNASGGQGGNSIVNISNQRQWPNSFVSGYAGFSQYNCANAFGASGGYGSLLIPWESSTCKIFWLADKMFFKGQDIAACELLRQVSQFQDMLEETGLNCVELFGHRVEVVQDHSWLDEFNKKYPPLPARKHRR
jgi:hypothetical protein